MQPAHTLPRSHAGADLRNRFMRWQCRVRQMAVREEGGRPNDGMVAEVTPAGAAAPLGHVVTVLCKTVADERTDEFRHLAKKTHDPAQRREGALRILAEAYYQKADTFSDVLTATFQPGSEGASALREAERCTLRFEAFRQAWTLDCKVWTLGEHNPLWQATYWHNVLFNPTLPMRSVILGFEPDWSRSGEG